MQPWSHQSRFGKRVSVGEGEDAYTKLMATSSQNAAGLGSCSIEPIRESLSMLAAHVSGEPEISRMTRALSDFLQNLRLSQPGNTAFEQFRAYHPIRSWLPWIPTAFLRISTRDPLVLIIQAYYHTIPLAIEPLFPKATGALFNYARAKILQRILKEFDAANLVSDEAGYLNWSLLLRVPRDQFLSYCSKHQLPMDD